MGEKEIGLAGDWGNGKHESYLVPAEVPAPGQVVAEIEAEYPMPELSDIDLPGPNHISRHLPAAPSTVVRNYDHAEGVWNEWGGAGQRCEAIAEQTVVQILGDIPKDEAERLNAVVDMLHDDVWRALRIELGLGSVGFAKPVPDERVQDYARDYPQLIREWQGRAPKKLAAFEFRFRRMLAPLNQEAKARALDLFAGLSEQTASAVIRRLAGDSMRVAEALDAAMRIELETSQKEDGRVFAYSVRAMRRAEAWLLSLVD